MAHNEFGLGIWDFEDIPQEPEEAMASPSWYPSKMTEAAQALIAAQATEAAQAAQATEEAQATTLPKPFSPTYLHRLAAARRRDSGYGSVQDRPRSSMHVGVDMGYGYGYGGARMGSDNAAFPSDNRHPHYSHPPLALFNMPPNDADGIHGAASPATYDGSAAASCVSSPGAASASSFSNETGRVRYNGRQLVPGLPAPAHQAATTLSPATSNAGPLQPGGGPLSKLHVVPPRPKPGRKPATEEPESKRKAQNRLSQRNFRQRKQKTVEELQEKLAQRDYEIKNLAVERARELARERELTGQKIRELECSEQYWRDECTRLQQRLDEVESRATSGLNHIQQRHDTPLRKSFDGPLDASLPLQTSPDMEMGCDRCTKDHCACFAEMTNDAAYEGDAMTGILRGGHAESDDEKPIDPAELETDFTAAFRKPNSTEFSSTEDKPDCGFCAGEPDLCLCKGGSDQLGNESTSLARTAMGLSSEKKPNMAMTGPGSCADCQANPQQRAWCQRVAQLRSEATPPNSRRNSSKSTTLETMEPKASTSIDMSNSTPPPAVSGRTVGCSEAFKLLDGRVDTEMDWRQLKPVPQTFAQQDARKDTFTMEPGMYSAMELDASSILTTLQHAQRPLRPRETDGTHARLVQEAEERRRASFSPMTKPNDHGMLEAVTQYSTIN